MKLLVTGGCGFIGSNFIRHVLTEHADDRIVNLDKLTYAGNPANVADLERHPRYSFVHGDIGDAKLVREVARGADAVRTGLEDNIRIAKDRLAASNAELVSLAAEAIRSAERSVATPAEARAVLGLGQTVP